MYSFPMCDFSHPHTSPKCDHTHRTHRGHYLVHHTKIQKIAAASTAAGGAPQGVHWLWKVPPPTQRMAWSSAGLRRTREAWREHMWGLTCPSGRTRLHLSSTLWRWEKREKWVLAAIFRCETVTRIRHPPFSVVNGVHSPFHLIKRL